MKPFKVDKMMMMKQLVLSIETTVEGGSLSILANREEIDGWSGSQKVSKAEEVLEQISNLLEKNNLKKNSIKAIAVSIGAGSLTGEKIGRAIAGGLAKSLNCPLIEVSVLESLLLEFGNKLEGEYITAIPTGKNRVQWQNFTIKEDITYKSPSSVQISDRGEFIEKIKKASSNYVMLAVNFRKFPEDFLKDAMPINFSKSSLAKLIGFSACNNRV